MHTRNAWQIAVHPASSDGRLQIYGAEKRKKKYKKGGATASELHLHANANKTQSPPFVPCPGIWQQLQLQTAYRSKGNSKLHRRNAGIRNAGMLKMLLGCLANDFEVATHIGQGVLKNSFHCPALSGERGGQIQLSAAVADVPAAAIISVLELPGWMAGSSSVLRCSAKRCKDS